VPKGFPTYLVSQEMSALYMRMPQGRPPQARCLENSRRKPRRATKVAFVTLELPTFALR